MIPQEGIDDARMRIKYALDGLWCGTVTEEGIIRALREAYGDLGAQWIPPAKKTTLPFWEVVVDFLLRRK